MKHYILAKFKDRADTERLFSEVKTVFLSTFIKNYADNIRFELYVQHSDTVETARKENTRKIAF